MPNGSISCYEVEVTNDRGQVDFAAARHIDLGKCPFKFEDSPFLVTKWLMKLLICILRPSMEVS